MVSQKSEITAYIVSSAVICAVCLCFLINGGPSYANADNAVSAGAIYTVAEKVKPPENIEDLIFDDSIWGRFAKALKKGLDTWLP